MQDLQIVSQNKKIPLVSFVIPYYNLPVDMLRECVDSVLALSLSVSEREIIIIDDGSDRCPMEEMMEYGSSIIYVRQPNRGLSEARNTGLDMAKGKYIQFVDSDDKLLPRVYEKCLDIVRYKDPDMVLFDYTQKEDAGQPTEFVDSTDGVAYMANNNIHASAWGYIFRKRILMGLRFSPGLLHEDEEFTPLLLLRAEKIYDTGYKAYFYRKRDDSITAGKSKKHILKRLNDFERIMAHLHVVAKTLPEAESEALRRRVSQLTMDYIYNIITVTGSMKQLNRRLGRMAKLGLYPLPDRKYSAKYIWFRKMANTRIGLSILMHALTMTKRKR